MVHWLTPEHLAIGIGVITNRLNQGRFVVSTHVRYRNKSWKHMLVASFSYFAPKLPFTMTLADGRVGWEAAIRSSHLNDASAPEVTVQWVSGSVGQWVSGSVWNQHSNRANVFLREKDPGQG
jgi:hypothetical protein